MPALTDLTPFQRHIDALQRHDPSLYRPFVMAGASVGLVRRDLCDALAAYPEIFQVGDAVKFIAGANEAERSAALGFVVRELSGRGLFPLRGEAYAVMAGWGAAVLATIDRGAYQYFGVPGFGVHVNGLVRKAGGLHVWIARRARDRLVAPGKLDNIIGGGLTAGYTAREVLIKEAQEEAGLDAAIAGQAIAVGQVSYACDAPDGAKRDTLFLYDLYLPEDLTPVNTDGEVESFDLLPLEEVALLVRDSDEFKLNVGAVIIDLAVRHGLFTPDMPGYERLVNGLRRRL